MTKSSLSEDERRGEQVDELRIRTYAVYHIAI